MIGVGVGIPFNRTSFGGALSFTNTNSLLFDGIDEYVDCGVVSAIHSTQNFSISCWVKKVSSNGGQILGYFQAGGNAIWLAANASTNQWAASMQSGSTGINYYNSTINTSQWYHAVMVFDGTIGTAADRLVLYVDGVSVTRTSNSGTINATTAAAGTRSFDIGGLPDASVYSDVYMDEVAIFDYSLDASQVSTIYNSGQPNNLNDLATPPVHWWRMGDGDTFPTINDVGTTGSNNGTMTNQEVGDIVSDVPS